MRLLVVAALVCLVSCASAQSTGSFTDNLKGFFGDLKDKLSNMFSQFGDTFKALGQTTVQTGGTILSQALSQGLNLVNTGVGQLANNLVHPVTPTTTPTGGSKRDLGHELQGLLAHFLGNTKTELHNVFSNGVHELQNLASHVQNIPLDQLVNKVDSIVATHGDALSTLTQAIGPRLEQFLHHHGHQKRDVDLQTLGQQLSQQFTPFVDNVKHELHNFGDQLKQQAEQLLNSFTHHHHTRQSTGSFLDNFKNYFKDLGTKLAQMGHEFGDTFKALGQTTVQTGATLLTQALGQGLGLVNNGVKQLANNLVNPAANTQPATTDTKRELSHHLTGLVTKFLGNTKTELQNVFTNGIHNLENLAGQALHVPVDQLVHQVDNIVATHGDALTALTNTIGPRLQHFLQQHGHHKRDLGDLLSLGHQLTQQFTPFVDSLKEQLHNFGDQLKQGSQQLLGTSSQSLLQLFNSLMHPQQTRSTQPVLTDLEALLKKIQETIGKYTNPHTGPITPDLIDLVAS